MSLADPIGTIEAACKETPRCSRRTLALMYADAIRQIAPTEREAWGRINGAISSSRGEKALDWIKTRAWAYVEGRIAPGSPKDTP